MERFMAYLDRSSEFYRLESRRLAAEDRRDEGNLARIRANVYGICRSVFQVLDPEKAVNKLDGLKQEWETSLSAALVHDAEQKAAIETIKLETLAEIRAELERGN